MPNSRMFKPGWLLLTCGRRLVDFRSKLDDWRVIFDRRGPERVIYVAECDSQFTGNLESATALRLARMLADYRRFSRTQALLAMSTRERKAPLPARLAMTAVLRRPRGLVRLSMPAVVLREPFSKAFMTSSRSGARSATTRGPWELVLVSGLVTLRAARLGSGTTLTISMHAPSNAGAWGSRCPLSPRR